MYKIKTKHTFHHSLQTRDLFEVDISKYPRPNIAWDDNMMCHGYNIIFKDLVKSSFSNSNRSSTINVMVLQPQVCLILLEDDSKAFIFKDIIKEYVLIHRDINSVLHM